MFNSSGLVEKEAKSLTKSIILEALLDQLSCMNRCVILHKLRSRGKTGLNILTFQIQNLFLER
jgi:hypothetical protein